MDENEKKEPETAQESPKPEDYSRYMGTLNRIYRRSNNPQRKKLGDCLLYTSPSPRDS